jgi:hypothetical protein
MTNFTLNYGALTDITDNRTTYSTKDSTGTDYTFEVYPLRISQNEINQALNGIDGVWFIAFETSITSPKDTDIQTALEQGLFIKLSMNCVIIDNLGFQHMVEFDKSQERYKIKGNNLLQILKNIDHMPLSDVLIDVIKQSNKPKMVSQGMTAYSKILFTKVFEHIYALEERIKVLEQK